MQPTCVIEATAIPSYSSGLWRPRQVMKLRYHAEPDHVKEKEHHSPRSLLYHINMRSCTPVCQGTSEVLMLSVRFERR
jgi:hypothetical protein